MKQVSPFPARKRKRPGTLFSWLWSGVTGLFDVRWLLGMQSAIVDRPAPKGATVTILIPAHNEAGHLTAAIEPLLDQTYPIYSIIIAENGSTDATGQEAEDLAKKYPGIIFALRAGRVGSKAGALNAGLDAGFPIGEFIVELDADTKLDRDAIEKLLPHFYDETVAVVCGQVLPQDYTVEHPSLWKRAKLVEYILGQGLTKQAQNSFGAVVVMCGCFSMFHRSLIGKFSDETMAEDMQKSWELQLNGWNAVYEPNSLCYAAEPETLDIFWNQRWRWLCGFLQCYQLMARQLLRRNLRLYIVVHYMFACALTGVFLNWILFPVGIYFFTKDVMLSIVYANVADLFVMGIVLSCYSFKIGGLRLVCISLASIPAAVCGTLVIQCNFLFAIISELYLQRRLTTWKSGHSQKTPVTQHHQEGASHA